MAQVQVRTSKWLSMVLRHQASDLGLEISPDGFVLLEDLLRVCPDYCKPILSNRDSLNLLVQSDKKQRFSLVEIDLGKFKIRANQGHSMKCVESESLLEEIKEFDCGELDIVVHGTSLTSWNAILESGGISRMKRNHIHFAVSDDLKKIKSGFRVNSQVLVYVDVEKAMKDGIRFFKSANNVVLCAGEGDSGMLSKKYFKKVVNVATNSELSF
jgi:2'-phosphotransferase